MLQVTYKQSTIERILTAHSCALPGRKPLAAGVPVEGCWFCLGSSSVDTSLVASVGEVRGEVWWVDGGDLGMEGGSDSGTNSGWGFAKCCILPLCRLQKELQVLVLVLAANAAL